MESSRNEQDDVAGSSGISARSFYGESSSRLKIRMGYNGITREEIESQIELPDASSDSESESEDEFDQKIASAQSDSSPNLSASVDNDTSVEDETTNAHPQVSSSIRNVAHTRWRTRAAPQVDCTFTGTLYPPPPQEELTPLQYFKMFFDDSLIGLLAEQTNIYSVSKSGTSVNTNSKEIEQFLGTLIMMGIIKLPRYRMYWSPSKRFPIIADAMGLTRFEKLKRFFHCNDNENIVPRDHPNFDKLFKVWPVLDSVLEKCKAIPQEEKHSVDEHIIPTKCRSGMRQYLPKKPNKWGIKVWSRCGVSGIVYDFEVYTGKSSNSQISNELGVMGNLVLRLTAGLSSNVGHKVYFDNLFSSIPLLCHLQERGIWCVSTIRANRMLGANKDLKIEKQLKELGRGSMDWRADANSGITAIRWYDNGIVQLVSTHIGNQQGKKVGRWSAKESKRIEIDCPAMVEEYNAHMGGVDLCDMLLALYRVRLRSCKYYMHIVYYCIGISITNGWLMYRRHCNQDSIPKKKQMDLCSFQSSIAEALLLANKEKHSPKRGRPSKNSSDEVSRKKRHVVANPMPVVDVRYDRLGHFPVFTDKQKRCRFCPNGYSHVKCCKCEIQLCLVKSRNCFSNFHTK